MSIKIEAVTPKLQLGESPFWDADTQSLYFVDVFARYINRYTPATNSYARASVSDDKDKSMASIVPIHGRKDEFLVGLKESFIRIRWDGESDHVERLETYAELKKDGGRRWNDIRVDFYGQLWGGYFSADTSTGGFVVPEKSGGLYTIQSDRTLKQRLDGISMPNGLDWNKNRDKFYFVDSLADEILQFDYDINSQEITNRQVVFKFGTNGIGGIPDGITIDENDNLWIASYGGGKIVNIDPRKPNTIIRTIDMGVEGITSVTFGGPNLDELYATTPSVNPMENHRPIINGGPVYRITGLGVRGYPGRKVKL